VVNSKLLTLTRQTFKTVIGDKMILEKKTNFQFVSSVTLFEGWPQANIYALLTHIKVLQPSLGQFVFMKGQADFNVYLVYQGEVQLMVEVEDPEDLTQRISLLRKRNNALQNLKSVSRV
jgi:hypothetical protein